MVFYQAYYFYFWSCYLLVLLGRGRCLLSILPFSKDKPSSGDKVGAAVWVSTRDVSEKRRRILPCYVQLIAHLGCVFAIVHRADTENILKCCVVLHNIVTKERESNGSMGTKNIGSVDSNAEITPATLSKTLTDPFRKAEMYRQSKGKVKKQTIQF